jgi:hypothetical protein
MVLKNKQNLTSQCVDYLEIVQYLVVKTNKKGSLIRS